MLQKTFAVWIPVVYLTFCTGFAKDRERSDKPPALWAQPANVRSQDLFYGQGGREHVPAGPFVFVEEDKHGNSPKFVVKDGNGVKWKVKLGPEARPETVVTRFVWAMGYATDEDYFLPAQQVENMPGRLNRGNAYVDSDGVVHDARWERMDHKKAGIWKWKKNPFSKTRELNGLRVLMALVNNYDMKDTQNSVYEKQEKQQYVIGDLGGTLGPTGSKWPLATARGDLARYSKSDFIKKVHSDSVDFAAPSWPMWFGVVPAIPLPYSAMTAPFGWLGIPRSANVTEQRWIGKKVPIEDVRWIAGLLKQLSANQIRSAFRAANYSPEEVEGFAAAVERRIAALGKI
ncbi:MAG: hypothetical protein HYX27_18765 [Acidobacteria bacterium]|nr:hypothetical protein [Acidobacteriota bacterium]